MTTPVPTLPPPVTPASPDVPSTDVTFEHSLRQVGQTLDRLGLDDTFAGTPWQAWVTLATAIFVGLLAGRVAATVCRRLAGRHESTAYPDAPAGRFPGESPPYLRTVRGILFSSAANSLSLLLLAVGLQIGLTPIRLTPPVRAMTDGVVRFLVILAIGWFLYNATELVELGLRRLTRRTRSKLDAQVTPLVRKTLRIFLVVVFALFVAENVFGADITAWLAGLGIAGLAVSLAAQESVKNVFGSLTIFTDRPFAVGDRAVVGGHDGTIEAIGFRSTRLRLLNGHLVTIPNSKVIDQSVENISRRPHIRRKFDLSLTYGTTPDKVREAMRIVRDTLSEPDIASAFADLEKFPPRVGFDEFRADSLNLVVFYWFYPNDYWAYLEHAGRVNLRIKERLDAQGLEFAFPTRTVHLEYPDPPPAPAESLSQS